MTAQPAAARTAAPRPGTPATLADRVPADPTDADALYEAFVGWAAEQGFTLYPAQDEAVLELVTGSHVILSTPTGSGKSLVAVAAHFVALAQGRRTYYTAPIKALVSEKFFDLVRIFGPSNVGMMTGDSSVNPGAPIVCCTAEILANVALRTGEGVAEAPDHEDDPAVPGEDAVGQVVMDEFHYYADPQRGWAWQVPLLELPRTQFLLMSATLGDVTFFVDDLERRTARSVAAVTGTERPVPLTFSYEVEPLHEVVEGLVHGGRSPAYLVHFTQKEAVERAQALLSTTVASREQRDAIAAELGAFRFGPGFGKTLSRLLRHGVGVHHAGMLPRYRRVVERLTQKGLLTVVAGTDTLGVGINVPIRTVVLTSLVKYDGVRMRHLTAREFHQVAGRAGRAGYDTVGDVVVMAPDHVIENRKLLAKAGDDPKKIKKIVRKKAPEGHVNWTDKTFERLRDADPEPLTSSFAVTHAMVLNVLARQSRGTDPVEAMRRLLTENHEPEAARGRHVRQAVRIYRSLRAAGVVERVRRDDGARTVRLTVDLPADFALNQPLSPFAYAVLDVLDPEAPSYALDVVSAIEATLDDPRQVLVAQEKRARGEAVAAMKADGWDYEERMAALEEVAYPKPLAEVLGATFEIYQRTNPWVADHEPSPKSVVRDMYERAATFAEYVQLYGLERTEGVLLRYLADAFRALRQTVPPERRDETFEDLVEWLGALVRATDSSLLDEWERLSDPDAVAAAAAGQDVRPPAPDRITANVRAFRVLVRNALFRRVQLVAREAWHELDALGDVDADGVTWSAGRWHAAMDAYFDEHEEVGTGPDARGPGLLLVTEEGRRWRLRQLLDDPAGHHDWRIDAAVDLDASDDAADLVLTVTAAGRL